MIVRDLIAALQACEPEYVVVMSRDAEGNGFAPVYEVAGENNVYVAEAPWYGDVHIHHLTDELRAQRYTDEDVYDSDDAQRAVVLWPMN